MHHHTFVVVAHRIDNQIDNLPSLVWQEFTIESDLCCRKERGVNDINVSAS
jgi:hypothetical protein